MYYNGTQPYIKYFICLLHYLHRWICPLSDLCTEICIFSDPNSWICILHDLAGKLFYFRKIVQLIELTSSEMPAIFLPAMSHKTAFSGSNRQTLIQLMVALRQTPGTLKQDSYCWARRSRALKN